MRLLIAALCLTVAAVGCESNADKLREARADEEMANAEMQIRLAHESGNLGECYDHLGIRTSHSSRQWTQFKKARHIDSEPSAMSDAGLKECLTLKVER